MSFSGLQFVPYRQYVAIMNPTAVLLGGKNFDMGAHASYVLNFGSLSTTYDIGAPGFEKSFLDYIVKMCGYVQENVMPKPPAPPVPPAPQNKTNQTNPDVPPPNDEQMGPVPPNDPAIDDPSIKQAVAPPMPNILPSDKEWVPKSGSYVDNYLAFSGNTQFDPTSAWTGTHKIWEGSIFNTLVFAA